MRSIISQPEGVKQLNRFRAYELLLKERLVSRPQLAEMMGLSRAGIAILVDDLIKLNLIQEAGLGDSRGGRPAVQLKFNPDAALALGACMHDFEWSIVVTNLDARVIKHEKSSISGTTPKAAIEALARGVDTILQRVDRSRLLSGIGIGSPGLVDIRTGMVKGAYDIGWIEVPIASMAEEATGFSVVAASRSKVGALAELRNVASRGIQNLIYITIGTGVSAGIIYHGVLFVGTNSSAGEFGHMTILPDGPLCKCGNHGCLQELVSEEAIANGARKRLKASTSGILAEKAGLHPEILTAKDVLQAAEAGDELSISVIHETAAYVAIGIGNLINLLNPELIVLGGPVVEESPLLVESIRNEVRLRAMSFPLSVTDIVSSSLGIDAGAIGASVLVLQQAASFLFRK
jgi:glucokinase-like ROK family protein